MARRPRTADDKGSEEKLPPSAHHYHYYYYYYYYYYICPPRSTTCCPRGRTRTWAATGAKNLWSCSWSSSFSMLPPCFVSDYTAFHEQMPFPKRQMPLVGVIWTKEGIWPNRKYLSFLGKVDVLKSSPPVSWSCEYLTWIAGLNYEDNCLQI